jgi:hypothetical protein
MAAGVGQIFLPDQVQVYLMGLSVSWSAPVSREEPGLVVWEATGPGVDHDTAPMAPDARVALLRSPILRGRPERTSSCRGCQGD